MQHYQNVCVSILKFRNGRLTDKDDIMLGETVQPDEMKREFLTRYYAVADDLPKLLVLDEPL